MWRILSEDRFLLPIAQESHYQPMVHGDFEALGLGVVPTHLDFVAVYLLEEPCTLRADYRLDLGSVGCSS